MTGGVRSTSISRGNAGSVGNCDEFLRSRDSGWAGVGGGERSQEKSRDLTVLPDIGTPMLMLMLLL